MSTFTENSVLAAFGRLGESSTYVVRAQPERLYQLLKEAQNKLEAINGSRIISAKSMGEVRARAYRSNRGLTLILGAVAFILVAVTAFGMAGFSSYWGAGRRRRIGRLRALGAARLSHLLVLLKQK